MLSLHALAAFGLAGAVHALALLTALDHLRPSMWDAILAGSAHGHVVSGPAAISADSLALQAAGSTVLRPF